MTDLLDLREYECFAVPRLDPEEMVKRAEAGSALPPGHYAEILRLSGRTLLARDPLGVHKLFYGPAADGSLVVANRIERAMNAGVALDDLASVPPGHVVNLDGTVVGGTEISALPAEPGLDLAAFQAEVAVALDEGFKAYAAWSQADAHVVCLSGGLDSTVVAAWAVRHLPGVTGITFSYLEDNDFRRWLAGAAPESLDSLSEDVRTAVAVAGALGLTLRFSFRPRAAVAAAVPAAVTLGQDWRDFNVHCATVNLFLAQDIRATFPGRRVAVLTGDVMNELMCDYHEEVVDGVTYYPQPRMSLGRRRRFFVRGLDAGDREVGVFSAHGLTVFQPFALVAHLYMRLSEEVLSVPDAKFVINGALLDAATRARISRSKRRAQVGGEDLGTLGLYHRLGLDAKALERLWAESLPAAWRGEAAQDVIQFGRYRTTPRRG